MDTAFNMVGLYSDRMTAKNTWRGLDGIHIGISYTSSRKKIKVNKQPKIKAPLELSRWYGTRIRAKKKGVEFNLTVEFIKSVMDKPCQYCNQHPKASELDRVVPSLGYVESNIVPACRRCNTVKSNTVTYDEMMFIADYLGWRI